MNSILLDSFTYEITNVITYEIIVSTCVSNNEKYFLLVPMKHTLVIIFKKHIYYMVHETLTLYTLHHAIETHYIYILHQLQYVTTSM